ncbi:MAG: hypothetical protein JW840_05625 [Candidatus Thermoplasmatota archaeon]|nr:hypothetical protein [Candidatus Thermoplasmatota archaeon]
MSEPTKGRKQEDPVHSWEDELSREDHLPQWQQTAFHAAREKLQAEHGTPDTVMRTGEAFGRGLFAQRLKEKKPEWTMKEWIQEIQEDVSKPLGTEFTFTKRSNDVATTFINRNPLAKTSQDQIAADLFYFGVMRGLFLSAFPKGELLVDTIKNRDHPEFILKTYASARDKLERDKVARAFTILKKEDGV